MNKGVKHAGLAGVLLATGGSCAVPHSALLNVKSAVAVGGEARFPGLILRRNGCLSLVSTSGQSWTLLFAPEVRLERGRQLRLGSRIFPVPSPVQVVITGAALRDDGVGWSLKSIDNVSSTPVPRVCTRNLLYVSDVLPQV